MITVILALTQEQGLQYRRDHLDDATLLRAQVVTPETVLRGHMRQYRVARVIPLTPGFGVSATTMQRFQEAEKLLQEQMAPMPSMPTLDDTPTPPPY